MFNPYKWNHKEKNSMKESESLLKDGEPDGDQKLERNKFTLDKESKINVNICWRVASGLMGIFFLLAAIVQHNDPDPYIWMVAYSIPCFVSWIFAINSTTIDGTTKPEPNTTHARKWKSLFCKPGSNVKTCWTLENLLNNILITGHIIYCFSLGIWTLASVAIYGSQQDQIRGTPNANMNKMNAEEAKELVGLCIIIAWLSLLRNYNFIHLGKKGVYLAVSLTTTPFIAWVLVEIFEQGNQSCFHH